MHGLYAATSKVENSAQGSSCKLKFVHGDYYINYQNFFEKSEKEMDKLTFGKGDFVRC